MKLFSAWLENKRGKYLRNSTLRNIECRYKIKHMVKYKAKLVLSDQAYFDGTFSTMICGNPGYCRETLEQLVSSYTVEEISVVNVTYAFETRNRSYERLVSSFELFQNPTPQAVAS